MVVNSVQCTVYSIFHVKCFSTVPESVQCLILHFGFSCTADMGHVTCDMSHVTPKSIALRVWEKRCFEDIFTKDP